MPHIDYYFSTLSPFTYLAGLGLEEIAGRHGATITYKPLDIMALFARTGGTPPAERHPSRQEYRAQEILRQAKKLGRPMALKPRILADQPGAVLLRDHRRAEGGRRRSRHARARRARAPAGPRSATSPTTT